ncbi:MAG: hypothetical protein ACLQCB_02630 [Spirochaetia bacterium]
MEMRPARIAGLLRAALALAAVLSLGSCGVLTFVFGSVFPETTVLAKAQADLSGLISSNNGSAFQIRVVEAGGYGYVVVTGNPPSGPEAFFYDLDLNKKATFTAATGLAGDGVMADASGNIALGQLILSAADLSILSTSNSDVNLSANQAGSDGFVGASTNYCDFTVNSYTMGDAAYAAGFPWAAKTIGNFTLSSTLTGLQLFAVLDDGNPSGYAYFVVGFPGNNEVGNVYFFSAAKPGFTITANILDSSPSRDNLELESLGFASGSIFAYDSNAASFVKINPSDGSTQASFHSSTDPKNVRFAYRSGGSSFYGFDTMSRVLTKYGAWW